MTESAKIRVVDILPSNVTERYVVVSTVVAISHLIGMMLLDTFSFGPATMLWVVGIVAIAMFRVFTRDLVTLALTAGATTFTFAQMVPFLFHAKEEKVWLCYIGLVLGLAMYGVVVRSLVTASRK